jgi:hypothetical protein
MENHRSKTANIWGFHLAHNTLLGPNELKYSWPIKYIATDSTGLITFYVEQLKAIEVVAI